MRGLQSCYLPITGVLGGKDGVAYKSWDGCRSSLPNRPSASSMVGSFGILGPLSARILEPRSRTESARGKRGSWREMPSPQGTLRVKCPSCPHSR